MLAAGCVPALMLLPFLGSLSCVSPAILLYVLDSRFDDVCYSSTASLCMLLAICSLTFACFIVINTLEIKGMASGDHFVNCVEHQLIIIYPIKDIQVIHFKV